MQGEGGQARETRLSLYIVPLMSTPTCPICRKPVVEKIPAVWPFCSERCKMGDLACWLQEEYRIEGRPVEESELPRNNVQQDEDSE